MLGPTLFLTFSSSRARLLCRSRTTYPRVILPTMEFGPGSFKAASGTEATDTASAHDSYVKPRMLALEEEVEDEKWPGGAWSLDLLVELTSEPPRIVIMERPFGTALDEVDEETVMSMDVPEGKTMEVLQRWGQD